MSTVEAAPPQPPSQPEQPTGNGEPDTVIENLLQSRDQLENLLTTAQEQEKKQLQQSLDTVNQRLDRYRPNSDTTENQAANANQSGGSPGEEIVDGVVTDEPPTLLEQIKQAPKYSPINERATTTAEKEVVSRRAYVLEQALLGKQPTEDTQALREQVAHFGSAAALAASRQQQEHGKKLIPERFYADKALQREMYLMAERIRAGEGIDVLLKEASAAGKTDMGQLRALKMLGTLIVQKYSPEDRTKWAAASEAERRLVRFGEIINMGVLMNTALLRLKKGNLPPDVAQYLRNNLVAFGQNEDIPNFLKKDLQTITGRLDQYKKTQHAVAVNEENNPSVLDEPTTPPLAGAPPVPAAGVPSVRPPAKVSELDRAIHEAAAELREKPSIPADVLRRWAAEHEQKVKRERKNPGKTRRRRFWFR